MTWTATLDSVEYNRPTYRCNITIKKDGAHITIETIEIDEMTSFSDAVETIKDKIRALIQGESLGSQLNKHIGKEITL